MKGGFMEMKMSKWAVKSRIPKIICIIALIVCLTSSVAFADTYTIHIPAQQQSGDYICWATCASMAAAYFNHDNSNQDLAIFQFIKGRHADPNNPAAMGNVADVVEGVREFSSVSGSYQFNALPFNEIKRQIDHNSPVVAGYPYHAIIIKGYDDSAMSLNYNDPADGQMHACSYKYLTEYLHYNGSAYWK